jgi:hypothetical protein
MSLYYPQILWELKGKNILAILPMHPLLKGNNIGDELQAEAGKKNSLPPNAEIANNTDNRQPVAVI